MKNIRIGTDDFAKLIREDAYYVDKTKMIEDLLSNRSKVMLFPRPGRFGKTLTMSMIENFFNIEKKEQNKDLFKGLYIENSKYYEERNTRPVIFLTFKELKRNDFNSTFNTFRMLIEDVYKEKAYIFDSLDDEEKRYFKLIKSGEGNIEEYMMSLKRLSCYLERYYHKKVIILIDDYDIPTKYGYINGFFEEILEFLGYIFETTLKGNESMDFGIMTGVFRANNAGIFGGFNNVSVYNTLHSCMEEYFGFTESETKTLLEYYGLDLNDEVKNMYDGYIFNNTNMYNPLSILNYAKNKNKQTYFINSDLVKNMISNIDEVNKKVIEDLIEGNSYEIMYKERLSYKDFDNYESRTIMLNLLLYSGYLTVDKITYDEFGKTTYVKIPNEEVRNSLKEMLASNVN